MQGDVLKAISKLFHIYPIHSKRSGCSQFVEQLTSIAYTADSRISKAYISTSQERHTQPSVFLEIRVKGMSSHSLVEGAVKAHLARSEFIQNKPKCEYYRKIELDMHENRPISWPVPMKRPSQILKCCRSRSKRGDWVEKCHEKDADTRTCQTHAEKKQ